MSERVVSDEQLAEIEQRADRLESIMADSHGDDEPCSAACEAAADVYDDVHRLVRALRDARDEAAREPIRTAIEYDHWRDAAIANRNEADALVAQLRDARAEVERLRLNSAAAAVAMTGPLYSDVESTAQHLHELGEQKAAKQIRMVLAQVRVAQRVASEFDQMVAELAAERAKAERVEALCDEYRTNCDPDTKQAQVAEIFRAALAGGEQGE